MDGKEQKTETERTPTSNIQMTEITSAHEATAKTSRNADGCRGKL